MNKEKQLKIMRMYLEDYIRQLDYFKEKQEEKYSKMADETIRKLTWGKQCCEDICFK